MWSRKRSELRVRLKLLGRHNVLNALAAIAVGLRSGITIEACAAAVSELLPSDKRGEVLSWRGVTIVNDSYNSNPRALDAMVDAVMAMPGQRHIVIAGRDVGAWSRGVGLARGLRAKNGGCGVTVVVGVRGAAAGLVSGVQAAGGSAIFVTTPEEAGSGCVPIFRPETSCCSKASRGVRLEKALLELEDPQAG